MNVIHIGVLAVLLGASRLAPAQLQVLPDQPLPCVFGGGEQPMVVRWQNAGGQPEATELRWRLYQTSSATVAPLAERPWKNLEVLPGQTVLEKMSVELPAVKAETKFLLQWLADSNRILGHTEVRVYPTNLLAELKPRLERGELGVLDPTGLLKPSLQKNDVRLVDLGGMALEDFSGRLAVIGPFRCQGQMREGLAQSIQRLARKGVAVVWLPPPGPNDEITPSFYLVPEGKGAVVVVHPELVANFAENPESQLNFVHCCKLALNPTLPRLPDFSTP